MWYVTSRVWLRDMWVDEMPGFAAQTNAAGPIKGRRSHRTCSYSLLPNHQTLHPTLHTCCRAFAEDWEGAAPRQTPQTPDRQDQPDFVRPGRFLSTLQSMLSELEAQEKRGEAPQGAAVVLKRMRDIQLESVAVLDRLQRASPAAAPRAA